MTNISQAVIDRDHELEGAAQRSSEELAEHRWHQTLDPDGPGHSINSYAKAIGRSQQTVRNYANGWQLQAERLQAGLATVSITDAVRLASQSEERRAMTEAIAEETGESIANAARGDNTRVREMQAQAQHQAEEKGTDPIDEARLLAKRQKQTAELAAKQKREKAAAHTLRYIEVEGKLGTARRKLAEALTVAQDVGFTGEEMELMREALGQIRAVLNLIDLRLAGNPDIDWDAELTKLGAS